MKIFISSVIRGLEPFRDAADKAARTLRHDVTRSEHFGASPDSPQRVCLAAVRECDVTILILGAAYGQPQGKEQLSATHEEYREARDRKDILVFIQDAVGREARQDQFVQEIQRWARGHFTASFSSPDELHQAVTRALYDLALSRSAGPVDDSQLQARAKALIPQEGRGQAPSLVVVVCGGPKQSVLRPAEIESPELADTIMQNALFGPERIFDRACGTEVEIANDALAVKQERASILLTPLGDVRILQPGYYHSDERSYSLPALIEEDVRERIARALRFAASLLDHVDPNRRLLTIVPIVSMLEARYTGWKTRREHAAEPGRMTMSMRTSDGPATVALTPVSRPRPALSLHSGEMATDFTVLLRREIRA